MHSTLSQGKRVSTCCVSLTASSDGMKRRLQKCKTELLRQVDAEGHTTALSSQLGAVCGSQGDCHRQLAQPDQAKGCYEESVQHLKACKSQDAEVRHMRHSVTCPFCGLA